MKSARFLGDTRSVIRRLPDSVQSEIGYQLDRVQRGKAPKNWKPMPTIGKGVCEIRVFDEAGTFRVVYLARLEDAIYVLHIFQKKSQATAKRDIDLAAKRYAELMQQ